MLPDTYKISTRATASTSDIKVGWNALSMAIAAAQLTDRLYNQVSLSFVPEPDHKYPIRVFPDRGVYGDIIPSNPEKNLAARLVKDMLDRHDPQWENQYSVQVETSNNIPPYGLNSSGAIASATARAMATFLFMYSRKNLSRLEQAYWAIHGEEPTTGFPAPPNTASASVYGGVTASEFPYPYRLENLRVHKKFVPDSWMLILAKPPELEGTRSTATLRQFTRKRKITGEYASEEMGRALRFMEAVDMVHPSIDYVVDALDYASPAERFMADGRTNGDKIAGFGEGVTYARIRENDREMAANNIAVWQSYLWRVALCDPDTYPESVAIAKEGLIHYFNKVGYSQVELIDAKPTNVGTLDLDPEIQVLDGKQSKQHSLV